MGDLLLEALAVTGGLFIRFAIPLAITLLISRLLKQLDDRWAAEAAAEEARLAAQPQLATRPCWQQLNCPSRLRRSCPAFGSDKACYDHFRQNGRLQPACRNCQVARLAHATLIATT